MLAGLWAGLLGLGLGWAGLGWAGWAGWAGGWAGLGWAELTGLGWAGLLGGWLLAALWAGWAGLVLTGFGRKLRFCPFHSWFWRAGACKQDLRCHGIQFLFILS